MRACIQRLLRKLRGQRTVEERVQFLISRGMKVGKNFHMLDECMIDICHAHHIRIGDDVTLAPRVQILAHDASTQMFLGYTKVANVNIGSRVFVGAGTLILPGVTIGDNVIIGGGSLVSKDLLGGYLYVGRPAQPVCTIDAYLAKQRELMQETELFGEEYTQRKALLTPEQQEEMCAAAAKYGIVFLK